VCACIVTGGKIHAIVHRMFQDLAVNRVAVNPALSVNLEGKSESRK
jgi:hypothetical protein